VQWKHFVPDEATWEMEDAMKQAYPILGAKFRKWANFQWFFRKKTFINFHFFQKRFTQILENKIILPQKSPKFYTIYTKLLEI
jgi:hypothetical protein